MNKSNQPKVSKKCIKYMLGDLGRPPPTNNEQWRLLFGDVGCQLATENAGPGTFPKPQQNHSIWELKLHNGFCLGVFSHNI